MLRMPSTLPRPAIDWSGPPGLSVAFTSDGPRCELSLAGRLDAYSLVALRAQVDQISLEPFDEIDVHVDDLTEVDKAGLAVLTQLRALAEARGARFRIDGVRETIRRWLPSRTPAAAAIGDDRSGRSERPAHAEATVTAISPRTSRW